MPSPDHDPVHSPSHYTAGDVECIDALRALAGIDSHIDHCVQSAVAYLWRWRRKDGPRDLAKARWYIDRAHSLAVQHEALAQPAAATADADALELARLQAERADAYRVELQALERASLAALGRGGQL